MVLGKVVMRGSVLLVFCLMFFNCDNRKKSVDDTSTLAILDEGVSKSESVIDLEVYDFEGFKSFLNKKDDKVHVINFWATWCAPCVKELPYFEQLNSAYRDKNVEVVLVSLDFPHLYESRLKPFIIKNKLDSKVIALDDSNMNHWIPKVDSTWSGSIPATIIYKNDKKRFYEESFTYEALETELKPFLN